MAEHPSPNPSLAKIVAAIEQDAREEAEARLQALQAALRDEVERLKELGGSYATETGIPSAYYDAADRLESLMRESESEETK